MTVGQGVEHGVDFHCRVDGDDAVEAHDLVPALFEGGGPGTLVAADAAVDHAGIDGQQVIGPAVRGAEQEMPGFGDLGMRGSNGGAAAAPAVDQAVVDQAAQRPLHGAEGTGGYRRPFAFRRQARPRAPETVGDGGGDRLAQAFVLRHVVLRRPIPPEKFSISTGHVGQHSCEISEIIMGCDRVTFLRRDDHHDHPA